MTSILAFLALLFGASGTGVTITGGSVNMSVFPLQADVEQRCQDLGSDCRCSETLHSNDDLSALPGKYWDPTGSATKECPGENNNQAIGFYGGDYDSGDNTMVLASTEASFPNGADPYVYQGIVSGQHHMNTGITGSFSNSTFCSRVYKKYTSGMRLTDPDDRLKILTVTGDSVVLGASQFLAFQANQDGTSWKTTRVNGLCSQGDQSGNAANTQPLCSENGWCRLEICIDQNGSTWQARFYIDELDTETSITQTHTLGTCQANFQLGDLTGVQMFEEHTANDYASECNPGGSSQCYQYHSHVMEALLSYDPTFRIGPAYELECPGHVDCP